MLNEVLFLIISYIIGSLSPAHLFGKLKLKKDLRKAGTKSLGASNVFLTVSKTLGIITGAFDIFKGFIVIYIGIKLNFNYLIIYAAGLLAIFGHMFPFYLDFKGGKGVATALGIALALFLFGKTLPYFKLIFTLLILYALIMQYYRASLDFEKLRYRKLYRLLSVAIPIIYFFSTKNLILIILGIVLIIYIIIDTIRLISKRLNKTIFSKAKIILKQKEKRKISTSTWFLLSSFLTILFFQKEIAILSITIFIFADSYSELFGKKFGTIKLIGDRTLQGSLAYIVAAGLISFILYNFITLKVSIFILAPLISMLVEQITLYFDDNLTVPIITALIISLL